MDRFVRIITGKRAGAIAKVLGEDDRWIYLETADIGETNYFKADVQEVDSTKVVDDYVPYFGKTMWCGWQLENE